MSDMFRTRHAPLVLTLCPIEESVQISESTLWALGHPNLLQMLINPEKHMLAIKACADTDRDALVVPEEFEGGFELSGRSLLKSIRKLTGWEDDLPRTVIGHHYAQGNIVVFDLSAAVSNDGDSR